MHYLQLHIVFEWVFTTLCDDKIFQQKCCNNYINWIILMIFISNRMRITYYPKKYIFLNSPHLLISDHSSRCLLTDPRTIVRNQKPWRCQTLWPFLDRRWPQKGGVARSRTNFRTLPTKRQCKCFFITIILKYKLKSVFHSSDMKILGY